MKHVSQILIPIVNDLCRKAEEDERNEERLAEYNRKKDHIDPFEAGLLGEVRICNPTEHNIRTKGLLEADLERLAKLELYR